MICPLMLINPREQDEHTLTDANECITESCAWWDEYDERCSMNVLSNDERARRLAQAALTKKRIEYENRI